MLITTYLKVKLPGTDINATSYTTLLLNVNLEKLQGVITDKHLHWKVHIDKTAKTPSENITLLRRICNYLPHSTRNTFSKSVIQSHIDYCSTIQGQSVTPHTADPHSPEDDTQTNNVCAQVNTFCPLFAHCKVMPIQDGVKFRTVTMTMQYSKLYNQVSLISNFC